MRLSALIAVVVMCGACGSGGSDELELCPDPFGTWRIVEVEFATGTCGEELENGSGGQAAFTVAPAAPGDQVSYTSGAGVRLDCISEVAACGVSFACWTDDPSSMCEGELHVDATLGINVGKAAMRIVARCRGASCEWPGTARLERDPRR